jgi:hypothetical protein
MGNKNSAVNFDFERPKSHIEGAYGLALKSASEMFRRLTLS